MPTFVQKRNCTNQSQINLIIIFVILAFSLIISALIFCYIGQGELMKMSYNTIKNMTYRSIFLQIFLRNSIYFLVVSILTIFGHQKTIYVLYSIVTIYFGISIIYITKIFAVDKMYLLYTIFDYIIYYPILFCYTYISTITAFSIKKSKKLETNIKKIDIITIRYFKIALISIIILAIYSLLYSYYLYLLL